MAQVNAQDLRIIKSEDDVLHTYEGAGKDAMTGVEIELAFFDPASPDLKTMSVCQNKVVKNAANAQCGGDFVRNEPTSEMLEINSDPGTPQQLGEVMSHTQARIECLTQKAADIGLKRSYFQYLPEKTATELQKNLMDIPRYQAFFGPPREDMIDIAAYFTVCKSNQVSVSYRDAGHMLDNVRRLYALSPFFYMITDNAAPFNEGQSFKNHIGMHHRASLLTRGGVMPYLFTAQTGDEYIREHIKHVMTGPLFVYYEENGDITRLPSGEWTTFNALADKGLNTATNYYFAQSILWPDVKLAALKNEKDEVTHHRFEPRMFGVGMHQHQTALLMVAAMAFDENTAESVNALLHQYGFQLDNPESLREPIKNAYEAARNHHGKFLDIPFGNGLMKDFARDFADILEGCPLLQDYESELAPMLTICRTGYTDSKVNAILFDTLKKATDFQRSYDEALFENPDQCAYTVFENELNAQTGGRIYQSRNI